jgi:hypothetical protein
MSIFDLNISDSAPAHYDDLGEPDHQVKAFLLRALRRFADILRRSSDCTAKYYPTMHTKDHTNNPELLWAYRLVRTKHYLKYAGGHKHSPIGFGYFRIPASRPMGIIIVGCWYTRSLPATIVSPSRICRDRNFRGFASVGLLDSNEVWVTLFREKRTNADVSIGSHLRGGLLYSDTLIRPTAI